MFHMHVSLHMPFLGIQHHTVIWHSSVWTTLRFFCLVISFFYTCSLVYLLQNVILGFCSAYLRVTVHSYLLIVYLMYASDWRLWPCASVGLPFCNMNFAVLRWCQGKNMTHLKTSVVHSVELYPFTLAVWKEEHVLCERPLILSGYWALSWTESQCGQWCKLLFDAVTNHKIKNEGPFTMLVFKYWMLTGFEVTRYKRLQVKSCVFMVDLFHDF